MNDASMSGPSNEGPAAESHVALEELLWRRVEGELSPEEETVLREALAQPEALALEEQVLALHAMLAEVEEVDVPEGMSERVQWLLRRKTGKAQAEASRPAQNGSWFVALAAAALIGAIGLVVLTGRSPSGPTNDQVAGTAVADRVPVETRSVGSFALEEGGQLEVTSTPGSLRLELDWRTGQATALLQIEGEGVSAAPGQPAVRTQPGEAGLEIEVLAGQRGTLALDVSQAVEGLTVRVVRGEQLIFEHALSREEIRSGSD